MRHTGCTWTEVKICVALIAVLTVVTMTPLDVQERESRCEFSLPVLPQPWISRSTARVWGGMGALGMVICALLWA